MLAYCNMVMKYTPLILLSGTIGIINTNNANC